MIIKNISLISKKTKLAILTINIIIDIILFVFIISSVIFHYNDIDSSIKDYSWITIALAVFSLIPLGDCALIVSKRTSLAYSIIDRFERMFNIHQVYKYIPQMNSFQQKFCEGIYGNPTSTHFIYVFGKINRGKTTAIFHLLKDFWVNSLPNKEILSIKNVTFIDCTNNRNEILDFFCLDSLANDRVRKFNSTLTILDNVECMGKEFIDLNHELFSSKYSAFVLIEDTDTEPLCGSKVLESATYIKDFHPNLLSIHRKIDISSFLDKSNTIDKAVFFALYFLTFSTVFIRKNDIREILNIKKHELNKSLKKIRDLQLFVPFPFESHYYYCPDYYNIKNTEKFFSSDVIYKDILSKFVKCNIVDAECRWVCLAKSSIEIINSISDTKRINLFKKATYNANYMGLYEELNEAIKKDPKKNNIFVYEKAYLSFYLGEYKQAASLYDQVIEQYKDNDLKKETMLHIIESTHGNQNQENMKMIKTLIRILKLNNDFYSLCAIYWELHIKTEQGIFSYKELDELRKRIEDFGYSDTSLSRSIIQRCFTDEIRCMHILGIEPESNVIKEFDNFLDFSSPVRKEYYYNLCVEANTLHYVRLIESIIDDSNSLYIEDIFTSANQFYEMALNTNYKDRKSKMATELKHLDLLMYNAHFDFEYVKNQIQIFIIHSQVNNVSVHEAFGKTLLMKALIADPSNLSNEKGLCFSEDTMTQINENYISAKKIYNEFNNKYGIFRLDFIIKLFNLLISNESWDKMIPSLDILINENKDYIKEHNIVETIKDRINHKNCSKLFILSLIKAYPIILQ